MTMPSLVGARVGKYRVLEHVATGGMGVVYKALDEELGRVVALKVLLEQTAAQPRLLERFRREARNAARLSHRNIVTLYEFGQADGIWFLAMEFVEGIELGDYIARRGRVLPEEARRIAMQAAKALDHAYQRGVTHRDIKPSNFLLAQQSAGRWLVKLTDMGLALTADDAQQYRVTRAGTTVGTVDYLAPEQARDSASADIRSDIYSLGCTLYHMLAGQPPFAEGGLGERVLKHIEAPPPDVRRYNPDISAGLWALLERMLAKSPEDRYQTPAELLEALRHPPEPGPEAAPLPPAPRKRPERPARLDRDDGEPPPAPRRLRRAASRRETKVEKPGSSGVLDVSAEQRQAAAGQFERAVEVHAGGGDREYAYKLLLSCCKLDPENLLYRQTLRDVGKALAEQKGGGGWLKSLGALPARGRFRSARRAGDLRKVLESGEEVLARAPADVGTHMEMAQAAVELGLLPLGEWLLEQARAEAPENAAVLRALAEVAEKQGKLSQAVALWEEVRKADPSDPAARGKINQLAAADTIARGNYRLD
jgi:serine/threonine protein kinase